MLRRQLPPLGVGDELAFGDAEQRVVSFVIFARREERLVGRDQRNAARISEIDQARFRRALGRQAVPLQFDIEPVAEQALQLFATRQRQRVLAADDGDIERPVRPAGERDQARGLAVEPVSLRCGRSCGGASR